MAGYLSGAVWQVLEKAWRLGLSLAVSVVLARALGPEHFGAFHLALSIVMLWAIPARLGLDQIIVREVVDADRASMEFRLLSVCQRWRWWAGVLAWVIAIGMAWVQSGTGLVMTLVVVLGALAPLQAWDGIEGWCQAHGQAGRSARRRQVASTVAGLAKVLVVALGGGVLWVAGAHLIEFALTAVLLWAIAPRRPDGESTSEAANIEIRPLLRQAWPLLLSAAAVMVMMRIDQIMIDWWYDSAAVGHYALAVRVSELWYFVPTAICSALFPLILRVRQTDPALARARLATMTRGLFWIGLGAATGLTVLGPWLVPSVFGQDYQASVDVLTVHAWGGTLLALGLTANAWLVAEGCTVLIMMATLIGMVTNVAANFILLPIMGPTGAAVATILGQFAGAHAVWWVHPATRPLARQQLLAWCPWPARGWRSPAA